MDRFKKHRDKFAMIVNIKLMADVWERLLDHKLPDESNPVFLKRVLVEFCDWKDSAKE